MASAVLQSVPLSIVRASAVDTKQRIPYNPQRTYPKKEALAESSRSASTNNEAKSARKISLSELLRRNISGGSSVEDRFYLGYETWIPNPPKVENPRSVLNAASLAYLGDCIYELYVRRHFLFPSLNIDEFNERVTAVVRCEAQDAALQKLLTEDILSREEREVVRWGKNSSSSKTRTKKRAGSAVYSRASSLETLVGYLYLTDTKRLDEVMEKIGFSTDTTPSET
ncbi:hypothetical protein M569_10376 [Genlisea aurea]|uniref:RNase III domain-containing protein n=1 Tax=Genlisea aurea TaxID=192259 RepID=S8DX00_9LAMI|nr:hypothetical protein M569_10376 [Genlisea aurea]